tara:strand:+ start:4132 stop:4596 length:465 start_codon:yes stop_codon:yes gene_type:complete
MNLRQISLKDQILLKKLYFESIMSIDESLYTRNQKIAWSSQAWENPQFNICLTNGKGFIMSKGKNAIGFATRYPENKLALFYIKGAFQRNGYGSFILENIEKEAFRSGISFLKTDASLLSYKLFLKSGWEEISKEKVLISKEEFVRYKMTKSLK